jgi:hypothetical protein
VAEIEHPDYLYDRKALPSTIVSNKGETFDVVNAEFLNPDYSVDDMILPTDLRLPEEVKVPPQLPPRESRASRQDPADESSKEDADDDASASEQLNQENDCSEEPAEDDVDHPYTYIRYVGERSYEQFDALGFI